MKKIFLIILLICVSPSIKATDSSNSAMVLDCSIYLYVNNTGFLDSYEFCGDFVDVGIDAPTNSLNAGNQFGTAYSIGNGWYEGYVNYNGYSYRFAYEVLPSTGNIGQVMITKE